MGERESGRHGRELVVWAFSDAHVGSDLVHGRESLADALRQSESESGFEWDIGLNLGDHSGTEGAPDDREGALVVQQYGVLERHRREQVYDLGGNHDRSDVGEPEGRWVERWLDPTGSHTHRSGVDAHRRPYPAHGTWERYSFEVGNLLFLMMSDRNPPGRRFPRDEVGGNPGGAVSAETFDWWRRQVEDHPHHIVITAHHYVLKDTTLASGDWEGCWREPTGALHEPFHELKPRGTPRSASYLCWVGDRLDHSDFQRYLEDHPGACALWLGGHTHGRPDDTVGGKTHVESRWGTHFLNVSALTRHHMTDQAGTGTPMSRVLRFEDGSDLVTVRCYLHTDDVCPTGFHAPSERTLRLPRRFLLEAGSDR